MAKFFNNNQILAVDLIPCSAIKLNIGGALIPLSQVFHHDEFIAKKLITVAYKDGNKYRSLSDNRIVNNYDALLDDNAQRAHLILDCDDCNFKSSPEISVSGTLYTNKLEYSLPRISSEQILEQTEQLNAIKQGAFHLLIQLYSCEKAYTMVLCPETTSYQATVQEQISSTDISITIKNLTAHQYLI